MAFPQFEVLSDLSTTTSGSFWSFSYSSSVTSGNIYGIRLEVEETGVSTGCVRGIRCEAVMGDTASAALLEAGLFTAKVSDDTATVTNIRVLSGTLSIGDDLTVSGDVVCINAHMQTRGDETISGVHAPVYIKNEAHGGNGLECSAAIYCKTYQLSGSVKGFTYLIDGGVTTDLLGTAFLRLPDDGTICADAAASPLSTIQNTDSTGFIAVVIGTSTRYIALYTAN